MRSALAIGVRWRAVSEPHAQAELNLAFAVEVGAVDVERLAEGGGGKAGRGVDFEAGEEVQRRWRGRCAERLGGLPASMV